jgi:signal transduction histidine kinase
MTETQSEAPVPRPAHPPPRVEAAAVIALTALSLVLAAQWQLTEKLYAVTRRWEYFQLDELPVGLLVLAIGLIWLSWRRYRQAGRELRARQVAEARLAGVLADNRRLAQEYLRLQELERKQLARDLHDDMGQFLNAIKLDAVSILEGQGLDPRQSIAASQSIVRSIDHVHGAVRDMIRQLRPVGLDELGLSAAIENCVDQWRQRLPETEFSLRLRGALDAVNESLTLTLYRLIQEALTNISRHAGAREVDIVLERQASVAGGTDELVLTVSDNGRGMVPGTRTAGYGLNGMRERVAMAGGSLQVVSAAGQGFSLQARLPASSPDTAGH